MYLHKDGIGLIIEQLHTTGYNAKRLSTEKKNTAEHIPRSLHSMTVFTVGWGFMLYYRKQDVAIPV